jgi:hypothetical protein
MSLYYDGFKTSGQAAILPPGEIGKKGCILSGILLSKIYNSIIVSIIINFLFHFQEGWSP